jgi:hypothetical protein
MGEGMGLPMLSALQAGRTSDLQKLLRKKLNIPTIER